MSKESVPLRVVDLFCGAGGFTLGAEQAGAEVVLGVDGWAPAIATKVAAGHRAYLSKIEAVNEATTWQRRRGRKVLDLWHHVRPRGSRFRQYGWLGPSWDDLIQDPIDIVIGGPPCQPFSAAGAGLGEDDERDGYPAALEAIRLLKPRACVLENVRGLLFERHAEYRERIMAELREIFAWVGVWGPLDAADFGVPQHRRRVFLVGAPHFIAPPQPTHRNPATSLDLFDRRAPWVSMDGAHRPSPTIATTDGVGLASCASRDLVEGLIGKRALTLAQCATLQDFPDDYPWVGTSEDRYRQVGNAVPRGLGAAVIGAIIAGLV